MVAFSAWRSVWLAMLVIMPCSVANVLFDGNAMHRYCHPNGKPHLTNWPLVVGWLSIGSLDAGQIANGQNQLASQVTSFADLVSFGGVCEALSR